MSGRALGIGLAALLMSLAASAPLSAQLQTPSSPPASTSSAPAPPAAPAAAAVAPAADLLLAPSAPENPLRRFEIVSLGAFPIMLFYSDFGFDLQRYFAHNFDSFYAPWPFKNPTSAPITDLDRYTRIGAALGACMIVGGIDAYIHAMKVRKARRLQEALESSQPEP